MSTLLSQDPATLQMLFTDDIYLVPEKKVVNSETLPLIKSEEKVESQILPETKVDVPTTFDYQGDNNKYFLVLIDDKIHTRMNPVHLEMLLKVMNAKKLELRDLAILNISRYPDVEFSALKTFFSCSKMVLFGITPSKIGLPPVNINKAETRMGVKMLATYSLEEMRNNADKKREFWNVMKNL